MKLKIFSPLRNLLRSLVDTPPQEQPAPTPAAPPTPKRRIVMAPRPEAFRSERLAVHQNGHGVELPLQPIIASLPLELQPRVIHPDTGELTITIPLEKVLAQLSRGLVQISFGELRQAAPDFFSPENDRDRVLVPVPLGEILPRLNPALITRRRTQKQVHIPQDISSPFDQRNLGHVFSIGPSRPSPAPAPSPAETRRQVAVPPPTLAPPASRSSITFTPTPRPPTATPASESGASAAPAAPPPQTAQPAPITHAVPPAPVRAPAAPPRTPEASLRPPATPLRGPTTPPQAPSAPLHVPATPPPAAAAPAPAAIPFYPPAAPAPAAAAPPPAAPAPPPAPVKPAEELSPLLLNLTALAEAWPEAIRKELVQLNLVDAHVALPGDIVERALKQGRIAFTWKTLRSWIKPAPQPAVSAHDGSVLDLPLKVVAPLFLARQKAASKPHQKVSIDAEIPNLFFGFPQPEAASATVASAPGANALKPQDTNFYVWDDTSDTVRVSQDEIKRGPSPGTKFVAKYATPNEVVSRAAALDGVVGALIALPDGLMVASRLAADCNGDTLAAFLPQIFGKVTQCTKELRMGELNNVAFTVGNTPWKIFRVNAIFFAAFGRAGEPLPTAQLAALAAELDHKPK